jgi:hypothetical protein
MQWCVFIRPYASDGSTPCNMPRQKIRFLTSSSCYFRPSVSATFTTADSPARIRVS